MHDQSMPSDRYSILWAAAHSSRLRLAAIALTACCFCEPLAAQSFKPPRGAGVQAAGGRDGNRRAAPPEGARQAAFVEGEVVEGGKPLEAIPQSVPMHEDGPMLDDASHDYDIDLDANYGCGRRFWVRAEYLAWWTKGFDTPPLVTTSPVGTAQGDAGVLGLPTTSILFGGESLDDQFQPGGQVRVGIWLDPCETAGVEASYFGLGSVGTTFSATSQQFPILARPFLNLDPLAPGNDAVLVAYPNVFSGNITVMADTQLQGGELQVRRALCGDCFSRVDWVAGWRYTQLDESLQINDSRTVLGTQSGLPVGTTLAESDSFRTENTFNGAQIGFITETRRCCVWVETRMTLALGYNHARTSIAGQTITTTPVAGGNPQTVVTQNGLLALPTNIGTYSEDSFAVIPQLGVTLGWDITCNLRATLGYSFLYWSQVARPGDQIDPELNLSQIAPGGLVGVARPVYLGAMSDFWAQGLNVGFDYRY